jgi:hypothetical protein
LVRSDNRGIQLDVGITPIYCVICQKQLPDLYEHLGSRYGQVGTIDCDFCGTNIHCIDNDNIVDKLGTTGYILVYYQLYRLEEKIWKNLKDAVGYDITYRHGGETVTLDRVIDEICNENKITLASGNHYTSKDGKITMFPKSVTKWFELLNHLGI